MPRNCVEAPVSTVSPELALVDPVLADSEHIASRLDGWLDRTEWRSPAPSQAPPPQRARRIALTAALLVSMLANGFLTSVLLFGHNDGPRLQPAAPASTRFLGNAAQQAIDMPPPSPSVLRQMTSK